MRSLVLIAGLMLSASSFSGWQPDPADELQLASAKTIELFREVDGDTIDALLANSYAFAIFPRLKRFSALAGWASGRGILVEQDRFTGYVRQRRFSLGFQLGYQRQGQILLFRDARALAEFKEDRINFTPQAGFHAGKPRKAADASFSPRVAVLSIGEKGLSVDAAIGGSTYRFTPVTPAAQDSEQ